MKASLTRIFKHFLYILCVVVLFSYVEYIYIYNWMYICMYMYVWVNEYAYFVYIYVLVCEQVPVKIWLFSLRMK